MERWGWYTQWGQRTTLHHWRSITSTVREDRQTPADPTAFTVILCTRISVEETEETEIMFEEKQELWYIEIYMISTGFPFGTIFEFHSITLSVYEGLSIYVIDYSCRVNWKKFWQDNINYENNLNDLFIFELYLDRRLFSCCHESHIDTQYARTRQTMLMTKQYTVQLSVNCDRSPFFRSNSP